MSSSSIIVDFQVLKESLSGLLMGWVDLASNALFLEGAEEGVPTFSPSKIPSKQEK